MSERISLTLFSPTQAAREMVRVLEWIKAMTLAGHRLVLSITPQSKTRDQEKKYHAMVGDIAQQAQHLGASWEAEDWKRLLIDKFARETGRTHGRVIPNLDSNGVVEVGVLSRKFSRKDGSEFIEWLHAWGAENGCEFTEEWVDPDSGEVIKTTWQQKVARREGVAA